MYLTSLVLLCAINMLAVCGVALLIGYTGLFTMGHAGFMAIGAYGATLLYLKLGVPYIPALLLGGAIAALISIIIGYPPLKSKLSGDYFAIATLGFGEIVRLVIANTKPVFNGALGIPGIPKMTSVWSALLFMAIGVYLMRNYIKSQYGKNCIAIQQQEIAAEMIGINVLKVKLTSLMISAFYCGVAGGMFAFYATFISPNTYGEAKSTDLLASVVVGGINSISGPLLASIVFTLLPEVLRFIVEWRLVVYGLVFVVMMLFRPEGFLGYKEISFKGLKKFIKAGRGTGNG
ncbi:MAG: branched-chain amino acid ABC transporter permease [Bacillota bacterium]|nr:branched-chain amino acid ABC transporter permease [Bacillota bacterium]